MKLTNKKQNPKFTTIGMMSTVLLACVPAIVTSVILFGDGVGKNIFYSVTLALVFEALCVYLRGRNILTHLLDASAILTALLFAMCLPPDFGFFKLMIGIFFAIVITKHCYGGLGHNIFNPAMVGYLVLLISFPSDFTSWTVSFDNSLTNIFTNSLGTLDGVDTISQATPLDPAILTSSPAGIKLSYTNFALINISWLIGGLYLLYKKIIPFSLPCGYLVGLFLFASLTAILPIGNQSLDISPLEHLLLGGSMMGAFFIITDPVTAAANNQGRWFYSITAGCLCILIRKYGGYPDGVAFSVLFMNTWVPLINRISMK